MILNFILRKLWQFLQHVQKISQAGRGPWIGNVV